MWDQIAAQLFAGFLKAFAFYSVAILVAFLIALHFLQRKLLDRVTDVLACCSEAIKGTVIFKNAVAYFDRRTPARVDQIASKNKILTLRHRIVSRIVLHFLPPALLVMMTLFFSFVAFYGAQMMPKDATASFALGGASAILPAASITAMADLGKYEATTLFMISIAFIVSYVRTIMRLVRRINGNDMNPISYYFLSLNMLTSVLVAIVARHLATIFAVTATNASVHDASPVLLAALAFLIGWNPAIWLDVAFDKVSQWTNFAFLKARPPLKDNLPQDMNLLMIQGLNGDHVDRLEELGIVNCQDLSERNAIVLWLRTPYTLELICDWLAQAHLCTLYEDERLLLLRQVGIRDICGYIKALDDDRSVASLVAVLNTPRAVPADPKKAPPPRPDITDALLRTHKAELEQKPAYLQLVELHAAMVPERKNVVPPVEVVQAPMLAAE